MLYSLCLKPPPKSHPSADCGENAPEESIDSILGHPSHHNHQVMLGVHPDHVIARADCKVTGLGEAREFLLVACSARTDSRTRGLLHKGKRPGAIPAD